MESNSTDCGSATESPNAESKKRDSDAYGLIMKRNYKVAIPKVRERMKADAEKTYLIVQDCKERVLRDNRWEASDDYSLFHLTTSRTVRDVGLFADCTFVNIFVDHRTAWGAPIPSTFQLFFEDLLRQMVPEGYKLLLNIVDYYEGYFVEEDFLETFVEPNNLRYFFLDKQFGEKTISAMFFECPLDKLQILNEVAFPGTVVDAEGFVMKEPRAELFENLSKQGNTDVMFRELVRNVHFAFRMWRDFNGLFLVTDKFDIAELTRLLRSSNLEARIATYIKNMERSGQQSR